MAGVVALMVGSTALFGLSNAEALTFDLDSVFAGDTPTSIAPYGSITFTDGAAGVVQITFAASLEASSEFLTEWDFNLDPALDPTDLVFTNVSGVIPDSIDTGTNAFKADGDGLYDVKFLFSADPPRLEGVLTSVWNVSCSPACGLDANDFNFLSSQDNPAGPNGPFHTAAHLQGIPTGCSGWVSDTVAGSTSGGDGPCNGTSVPEPSTLLLLGSGLVGLPLIRRLAARRRG